MRITATIDIDEEIIMEVSEEETLDEAIKKEFSWIHDSGMTLVSYEKIDD